MIEILKQNQFEPLNFAYQVCIVYAATNGYLDSVPLNKVRDFEKELYSIINSQYASIISDLQSEGALNDTIVDSLKTAITECQKLFLEDE